MAPQSLTPKACDDAIVAFLESQYGVVHCEDVGPLLGAASVLCAAPAVDAVMQRYWSEAANAALSDGRAAGEPIHWTHVVLRTAPGAAARMSQPMEIGPQPRPRPFHHPAP